MARPVKTDQGTWRVQIEVAGVRDSGTFPTRRDAAAWADARSTEIRTSASDTPGANKTLRDALRRYSEDVSELKRGWRKERLRLAAFEGPAHRPLPIGKVLSSVTSGDVAAWRDARLKLVARGSVLRDMTLLSSVLEIARKEWGWCKTNVVRDVGKPANPDHREVTIPGPQIRAMLRQAGYTRGQVRSVGQAVAVCFLAALSTGMRAGELCGLRWSDVRGDYVTLAMTKSGKGRDVPISAVGRRLIERMRGFDDELVFGLTSQSLDALFRKFRTRAGLAGFTFHDARHTAATRLAQRLHVLDLCKVFGWANTKRALTYYNPRVSDLAGRL